MIESLVRMTIEDNAGNRDTIQRWINQWYPSAVSAVASILEEALEQTGTTLLQPVEEAIDCYYRDYLRSMNLEPAS
jgi:hypothetical protein